MSEVFDAIQEATFSELFSDGKTCAVKGVNGKDGYLYEVVVQRLPHQVANGTRYNYMVSVMSPERICYGLGEARALHPSYVAEKFFRDNCADLELGTMTAVINRALAAVRDLEHETE